MKKLLIFSICVWSFFLIHAQDWVPQGLGLLPVGYTIWSISAADDNVIWATASKESLVGTPVPLNHQLKVLRSVDGGLTWDAHTIALGRFSWDIHAVDANIAWITTLGFGNGLSNALFKTEDGGLTWENKLNHFAAGVYVRQFDEDHFIVQTNDQVAISDDRGNNWTSDTIHEYLPNEYNTLAAGNNMVASIGDTLWVGTSLGRIIRFTDFGGSYEVFSTGVIHLIQAITFADHLRGMAFYYDSGTGAFGLLRTYDGGSTWELTPSKPPTSKEYNITYVPGTEATFIAITDIMLMMRNIFGPQILVRHG